jgi:hypothetical protein
VGRRRRAGAVGSGAGRRPSTAVVPWGGGGRATALWGRRRPDTAPRHGWRRPRRIRRPRGFRHQRNRRGQPGVEEEGRARRGRSVRLGRERGAGGVGFGGGGGMLLYEGGSG